MAQILAICGCTNMCLTDVFLLFRMLNSIGTKLETKMDGTKRRNKQKSSKRIKVDESSGKAQFLGRGCHGTIVFKGRYDGREVAVKRIQIWNAQIETGREKELQALISCQHPNVLQLYKVEKDNSFMYFCLNKVM